MTLIKHQLPCFDTQAPNVDTICACLPKVASDRCPNMEDAAQAVANKFGRALLLYSKCHNRFNGQGLLNEDDVVTLRKLDRFTLFLKIMQRLTLTGSLSSTGNNFRERPSHRSCTRSKIMLCLSCSNGKWVSECSESRVQREFMPVSTSSSALTATWQMV